MDAQRFDTVAKALAYGTSRRRVVRGMVAGIGGGALIGLTGRQASAGRRCCRRARRAAKRECQEIGEGCSPDNFTCTNNGDGTCSPAYGCFC
jgi:hypothetical protein